MPIWAQILINVAQSGLVIALLTFFLKRLNRSLDIRSDGKQKAIEEKQREEQRLADEYNTLKSLLVIQTHNTIYELALNYINNNGITKEQYDHIQRLYKQYIDLVGEDEIIDWMMTDIKTLPKKTSLQLKEERNNKNEQ